MAKMDSQQQNAAEVSPTKKHDALDTLPSYQDDGKGEKSSMHYRNRVGTVIDTTTVQPGADMAYELKVAILNEAILDLGMGKYQWWTFVLTGFGWFVDNVSIRSSKETDIKSNKSSSGCKQLLSSVLWSSESLLSRELHS
jgi:hypothetical protein